MQREVQLRTIQIVSRGMQTEIVNFVLLLWEFGGLSGKNPHRSYVQGCATLKGLDVFGIRHSHGSNRYRRAANNTHHNTRLKREKVE